METLRKGLDKVLEFVCCVLLGLMTIFATWQVASRYVFNKPSTVTEELVLICFVWMGLLGAAYVFGKQEHMRMSFLVDKLSEKNQEKMYNDMKTQPLPQDRDEFENRAILFLCLIEMKKYLINRKKAQFLRDNYYYND